MIFFSSLNELFYSPLLALIFSYYGVHIFFKETEYEFTCDARFDGVLLDYYCTDDWKRYVIDSEKECFVNTDGKGLYPEISLVFPTS